MGKFIPSTCGQQGGTIPQMANGGVMMNRDLGHNSGAECDEMGDVSLTQAPSLNLGLFWTATDIHQPSNFAINFHRSLRLSSKLYC